MSDLGERLASHRVLVGLPAAELEWLARHGERRRYRVGELALTKGQPLDSMLLVFSGRVVSQMKRASGRRDQLEWGPGEVTARLPFSRMAIAPGDTHAVEETDAFVVHKDVFPEMMRECPGLVERLVHNMLDRAQVFASTILRDEHLQSLGRLASGLAHELNNPASAAARSSKRLREALGDALAAAASSGAAPLTTAQRALMADLAGRSVGPAPDEISAMESLEREESFSDWLDAHALDVQFAEPLAESGVTVESLDALSACASPAELAVMLRSLATGFTVHALARDVEQAADRVHRLVSAVAGFTQLDRGVSKAPKDVAKGIADTVTMLGMKARAKAVSVHVDLDDGLPDVMASDDLNHVWLHLIDNALDAVPEGGSVHVRGSVAQDELLVCVTDNGPGIPPEIAPRVFDPFFTTKPPGSGVGLGLDIVRRVLASNDGQVALRAEPGRTEFRVTLPVRSVLEPIA